MSGRRPIGRTTRMYVTALGVALGSGCARAPVPAPVLRPTSELELPRLRAELASRDQTIQQLESRLALIEAEQRGLRERVAQTASRPTRERDSAPSCDPAPGPRGATDLESSLAEREPRPVLRLHAERADRSGSRAERVELSSGWNEPTTHPRLAVVPLPSVPRSSATSSFGRRASLEGSPAPASASIAGPPAAASTAADELYLRALDLMQRREFAEALRELDAFLRSYPEDPRFVRAQLWRGEVLFGQREYARALVAYELALKREPDGARAAECLLRIARCHFYLGASERGRASLGQLKTRFPESEAARRADQVMREDS